MLEFRSNGRRVTLDQFMKNIEEQALDVALEAVENRVHGIAASIVDPETGRHADVFVRRRGDDLGVTIHTRGSQAFARELERRLGVEQGTVMSTASHEAEAAYYAGLEEPAAIAARLKRNSLRGNRDSSHIRWRCLTTLVQQSVLPCTRVNRCDTRLGR